MLPFTTPLTYNCITLRLFITGYTYFRSSTTLDLQLLSSLLRRVFRRILFIRSFAFSGSDSRNPLHSSIKYENKTNSTEKTVRTLRGTVQRNTTVPRLLVRLRSIKGQVIIHGTICSAGTRCFMNATDAVLHKFSTS